jgi:hypothetical protein
MSPSQLIRFSPEQLDGLARLQKQGGGGRRIERVLALVVAAVAIGLPLVLVLLGFHPMSAVH